MKTHKVTHPKTYKIMRAPDGFLMQVIRPNNPRLALALAQVAFDKQDGALLARLPEEVGFENYKLVGFLAGGKDGVIVDKDGHEIGRIEAGDSMVVLGEREKACMGI